MTAVGVALAVVFAAVIVAVCWWRTRQRDEYVVFVEHLIPVRVCDLCETEAATVHLVETFDDDEEREFGGGSTAMRADYCQPCANELGVG